MDFINLLLVGISGVCWSLVYIDCIRTGFKQKTYCMPLFALGLNIAWEGLYAFTDLFVRRSVSAQAMANSVWFLLDIVIVVTWFLYGRRECRSDVERKCFVPWSVVVLLCCAAIQVLFYCEFGSVEGEKYSAFLQNIAMSVAFLYMLARHKSSKGQTMLIAVCKCIGTVTPTILGTLEGNTFILVTGIICFIFDAIYIVALSYVRNKENKSI